MSQKLFIETYGCQMNVSDSEVVVAILQQHEYVITDQLEQADLILINTCSIRENAEQRVLGRVKTIKKYKKANPSLKIGIIGCMAERLKDQLFGDDIVDLVAGPDAYRNLPDLLSQVYDGGRAINTELSKEETYDELIPVRMDKNGVTAFVSIMRGCDNFCTYCVVPYTRGRERSRNPETILRETRDLIEKGYKEVTLLGQNVNSYSWNDGKEVLNFAGLIGKVASLDSSLRVRFATSHPKDISDALIDVIAITPNICKHVHLPVQSGSTAVLEKMNRKYTREQYLERIEAIKSRIPGCAITTDIIAGFCGETEQGHQDTLSLMNLVKYDFAFMFKYSERPDTFAAKKFKDDVPEDLKTRRLNEIINLQSALSLESYNAELGKIHEVLIEGTSKKSGRELFGRTSQNKVVVFPSETLKPGGYARVQIISCTSATLRGELC